MKAPYRTPDARDESGAGYEKGSDACRERIARAVVEARRTAAQQMALGVQHEVNNALQSLVLHAELLRGEPGLSTEGAASPAIIQAEALRIGEVIHRLWCAADLPVRAYAGEQTMVDFTGQDRRTADGGHAGRVPG